MLIELLTAGQGLSDYFCNVHGRRCYLNLDGGIEDSHTSTVHVVWREECTRAFGVIGEEQGRSWSNLCFQYGGMSNWLSCFVSSVRTSEITEVYRYPELGADHLKVDQETPY